VRFITAPILGTLLIVGTPGSLLAQAAANQAELTETLPASQAATLVYANRPITILRARILSNGPTERVNAAIARLDELVDNRQSGPVTTQIERGVLFLKVADRSVFNLVPADLDPLVGETLEQKGSEAADRLRRALAEAVELRTPGRVFWAISRALAATATFALAVFLLRRLYRRATRYLIEATDRSLGKVLAPVSARPHGAWFATVERRATTIAFVLISVIVTYWWITFVLRQFPYTRPWGESMRSFLIARFSQLGLSVIGAIPGLFMVLVIAAIARVVVQLSNRFFRSIENGDISVPWIHQDTASATRRFAAAMLWIFALMVAYPYIPGAQTDAFKGISVFIGLVVSLGSSGIVNQLMSGLTIIYSRALKVGEVVKVGDVEGMVTTMNMLSIKVRTFQGEEITVPNAVVITQSATNYTRPAPQGGAFLGTEVTIGYDTPWRQVKALLVLAAERTSNLRREPKPRVLQRSLEDFYVRYRLLVCLENAVDKVETLDRLLANIQDTFNEFGVQIMSPHYVFDPSSQKTVPTDKWFDAPAAPDVQPEPHPDAVGPSRAEVR
jgi:small-conductance mechanosensitive channel